MEGQTSTFSKLGVLKSRKYPSRSIRKKKASKQTKQSGEKSLALNGHTGIPVASRHASDDRMLLNVRNLQGYLAGT